MLSVDGGEAETNIRQRGDVGGSAKKVGKRIKELERIYGIKNGGSGYYGNQHEELPNNSEAPNITQEQLAAQMGISVDTLQNYKMIDDTRVGRPDGYRHCNKNYRFGETTQSCG